MIQKAFPTTSWFWVGLTHTKLSRLSTNQWERLTPDELATHHDPRVCLFPGGQVPCHSPIFGESHVALKALSLLDISTSPPVYAATQPSCLFLWQWQQGNDSKEQLTCQVIERWNDSSSVPVSSNFDFLCGLMSSYTNTHTHTHIHQNYKVSSVLD